MCLAISNPKETQPTGMSKERKKRPKIADLHFFQGVMPGWGWIKQSWKSLRVLVEL